MILLPLFLELQLDAQWRPEILLRDSTA